MSRRCFNFRSIGIYRNIANGYEFEICMVDKDVGGSTIYYLNKMTVVIISEEDLSLQWMKVAPK